MDHKKQRASGGRAPSATAQANSSQIKHKQQPPSAQDVESDVLTLLARKYWSPATPVDERAPFDPIVVESVYQSELVASNFSIKRTMILELGQYLECFLWPNFDAATSSDHHVSSIVLMINEKFRENVPCWGVFAARPADFAAFFRRALAICLGESAEQQPQQQQQQSQKDQHPLSFQERIIYIAFLVRCFNSLENELVGAQIQRLVSLGTWHNLLPGRLEEEFKAVPKLRKYWQVLKKKDAKQDAAGRALLAEQRRFLFVLMKQFLAVLASIPEEGPVPGGVWAVRYCERFLELLIDLEAQLPTRRYFNTLMNSAHVVTLAQLSALPNRSNGTLFAQLLDTLKFYARFEISDHTGVALTDSEVTAAHYAQIAKVQQLAFRNFDELREFALLNVGAVDTRAALFKHFDRLSDERLVEFAQQLHLVEDAANASSVAGAFNTRFFLLELLVNHLERRQSQMDILNAMPLYPTEALLWDENVVPSEYFSGEGCLALPKLNLQFLTIHDYLLRNMTLFRLESAYEIREDITDAVRRLAPRRDENGGTLFQGWARMALPISAFSVVSVGKPSLAERHPSSVRADVTVSLENTRREAWSEWEKLRKHDIAFLVTVRAKRPVGERNLPVASSASSADIADAIGIQYVRGCEIEGLLDSRGRLIDESFQSRERQQEERHQFTRLTSRTFRVWLDPNQYQIDVDALTEGERRRIESAAKRAVADLNGSQQQRPSNATENVYDTFNILVRRKPEENNFKAVLDTIRSLMNTRTVIPDWLHDVFLGYGDPRSAFYAAMPERQLRTVNFNDTFLTPAHVVSSFPQYHVKFVDGEGAELAHSACRAPFKLTFPDPATDPTLRATNAASQGGEDDAANPAGSSTNAMATASATATPPSLLVTPFTHVNRGPYPRDIPKKNAVPFTPVQVEAIRAGVQPGLTLVVGPPGTGKTDVAVQIVSNWYHNFPDQRILLVTHSNQALNQIFEKIMELDIDERHLLRLGHGEEELATTKDFSRSGRVNYILERRIALLQEVARLAASLDVPGDVAYTCETAGHFHLYQVLSRWEAYVSTVRAASANKDASPEAAAAAVRAVSSSFPFTAFFADAPQPLFHGKSFAEDWDVAQGCWRHLRKIFQELEAFRAFELLRSAGDRINYLLVKEARIIAMTCTHAALKRRELVELGFKFDNVLMEESAQILEIETFIPLLLQTPDANDGYSRLKRIVMIGDHHQLPPVIKNMAFQRYSNLEQSLFTRFVRLGVRTVDLDRQGRARASIAQLYNWRYKQLGDLQHVQERPEYQSANAGFAYDFQLVDVGDHNGQGESEPSAHFIQNLAEAEYVVATYMYMRLQGYPRERITILTTYNGQKALIRDVLNARCSNNPMFGDPDQVTTVDKFQGSQNDYVLLSLVRTKTIGHVRDVRRLVVAMSRAKLGLYVFARASLFQDCLELKEAFSVLQTRPSRLALLPQESFPTQRSNASVVAESDITFMESMPAMADYVYKRCVDAVRALNGDSAAQDAMPLALEAPLPTRPQETEGDETEARDAPDEPAQAVEAQPDETPAEAAVQPPTPSKRAAAQSSDTASDEASSDVSARKKARVEPEEKDAAAVSAEQPEEAEDEAPLANAGPKHVSVGGRSLDTLAAIMELTVVDIKAELSRRDLSTSGLKKDLAGRLHEALSK
ncbi:aquarius [Capsaspora owczarzaki ATCC 30864]|uniref:aquarius n=1 Tax=Capsaspora owczarzaki (strain ATCC 30864) TaxID=595528 RepID=UPI0003523E3A|nr:aquarius [Capsaspora owczarzaki ATCC 30864]|eukprot:XP_004347836.2 aquarius [Capsaspora owczarzaki ATCC 30864]